MFQAFGKLSATAHINKQGTGLGLNLCKNMVEKMGGYISFESTHGQGTCFTVSIKISERLRTRRQSVIYVKEPFEGKKIKKHLLSKSVVVISAA